MSRDTWAGDYRNPVTLAKWLYANANPEKYTDPSGNKSVYYDRKAAVDYALKWATSINKEEYGASFDKSDCTNFVSQALKAGGLPEDNEWFYKKPGIHAGTCGLYPWPLIHDCGEAWAATDNLYIHLKDVLNFKEIKILPRDFPDNRIPKTPVQLPISLLRNAQKGDVVFYKQDVEHVREGGLYNHAAIIVGFGTMTYHGQKVNAQSLNISDHSGPYPGTSQHTINDNQADVLELVIIHIPDVINIQEDPLSYVGRCE